MSGVLFWAIAYLFRDEIKQFIRECLKDEK